jgi:hypothetical protein
MESFDGNLAHAQQISQLFCKETARTKISFCKEISLQMEALLLSDE